VDEESPIMEASSLADTAVKQNRKTKTMVIKNIVLFNFCKKIPPK
jgi:hypothetical protein